MDASQPLRWPGLATQPYLQPYLGAGSAPKPPSRSNNTPSIIQPTNTTPPAPTSRTPPAPIELPALRELQAPLDPHTVPAMSADDALWASLTRAAAEAGRAARSAAEHAADELSAAFGLDQQRLRWPGSDVLAGPIIPEPYSPPWERQGRRLTWHDGYMASAALSVARTLQTQELQPATVGLVAAQAALHLRPGGYRLMQVGFNSSRVLRKREWRRLVSSPLLHADLPHLAANCHTLVLEGLPLEQRLGSAGFLALVASSCALSQALVRERPAGIAAAAAASQPASGAARRCHQRPPRCRTRSGDHARGCAVAARQRPGRRVLHQLRGRPVVRHHRPQGAPLSRRACCAARAPDLAASGPMLPSRPRPCPGGGWVHA